MPATQAGLGYGSKLSLGSSTAASATYTELGEVTSIGGPGYSTDAVDVTHMQSPDAFREFVVGLTDPGELSLEMNYVPGGATEMLLDELYDIPPQSRARRWRQEFPDGNVAIHFGFMTNWERNIPLDDKMSMTVTIKLTGRSALATNDSPIP
jgi:hypothetical protein